MKLISIINRHYESSSWVTGQYKNAKAEFIKTLKKYFGKENVIVRSCPHFEFTGFIKYYDKYVYFSTGDLRFRVCNSMLVRTAKNDTDWTGGHNYQISYDNEKDFDIFFIGRVTELLKKSVEEN